MINDYGFIETPYRRVIRELAADSPELVGRIVREDVTDGSSTLARAGDVIDEALCGEAEAAGRAPRQGAPVRFDRHSLPRG